MLGVFSLNTYIGLKDTVMSKLQPMHQSANFVIATVDLVSASLLIYYGKGKRTWVLLSGVFWPIGYFLALFIDTESKLCLFSGQNCFKSVGVSFEYLILGSAAQGWLLWPYTMITVISLLTVILILSVVYSFARTEGTATPRQTARH